MIRLQIELSMTEAEALTRWATSELRDPRDQIRFLLQRELKRRSLLPDSDDQDDNNQNGEEKSDE